MTAFYLAHSSHGLIEMRQQRFKEKFAGGVDHPHDVCAYAHDKAELREMLVSAKMDTNEVDWGSIP